MKKIRKISIIMSLVFVLSAFFSINAFAASYPAISSSNYCEFTAQQNINVYKDTACKTRGTSSPSKSYSAYVTKGDVCYIYKITSSYIQLNYPVGNSRRTGYIKRSDLFDKTEAEEYISSAKAKVSVYKSASGSYIAKGDRVWRVDPKNGYSGYRAVIYDAKSGNRAYKMGYITLEDLDRIKGVNSPSAPNPSETSWQWPVKDHKVNQGWGVSNSSRGGYHAGMDLDHKDYSGADKNIYAAANGTVVYKGFTNGNGYHIILSHKIGNTTVKTLYSHLSSYAACPGVGGKVTKGDKIGVIGSSGNSTGTHLHFAVFTGSSTDPFGYYTDKVNSHKGTRYYGGKTYTYYDPSYVIKYNKLP